MDDVGIITCGYVENNLNAKIHAPESNEKFLFAERCITSAAIIRVPAYLKAGGFDNDLFVDYVDFDFAVKVRHVGYQILFMNDTEPRTWQFSMGSFPFLESTVYSA